MIYSRTSWLTCLFGHARKYTTRHASLYRFFTLKCFQDLKFGHKVLELQSRVLQTSHSISFHLRGLKSFFVSVKYICYYTSSCSKQKHSTLLSFRSEPFYDDLVNQMVEEELALKAIVKNAELLVFPSTKLPLSHWSKFMNPILSLTSVKSFL